MAENLRGLAALAAKQDRRDEAERLSTRVPRPSCRRAMWRYPRRARQPTSARPRVGAAIRRMRRSDVSLRPPAPAQRYVHAIEVGRSRGVALGLPRRPDRRDAGEPRAAQRALARDFPPDRRELSRDRRAGRLAQHLAPDHDAAVAGLGPQRDVGPRTARPRLCAAHLGRAAADRTRAALLRRRADGDRRPLRGRAAATWRPRSPPPASRSRRCSAKPPACSRG